MKYIDSPSRPLTDRAKQAINLAADLAQRRDHNEVTALDLVWGLAKAGSRLGYIDLTPELRVTTAGIANVIRQLRPQIPHFVRDRAHSQIVGDVPASEELLECLRHAFAESERRGFNYTGAEQLLFGIYEVAASS